MLMAARRDPPLWPEGFTADLRPIPRRPSLAVCETRLVTAAEIDAWLAAARAGESLVYCTGPCVPAGPTKARVLALVAAGAVRPHNRPLVGCLGSEYLIVRRPSTSDPVAGPSAQDRTPADEAMEAIFAALERCAERGRRAYSDFELARIAGLATRHQAAWRVRKLAEAGRIRVETVEAPDRTRWRVVTVGGRRTARPEGLTRSREAAKGGTDAST